MEQKKKNTKKYILIGAIAVVIVMAVLLIFLWPKGNGGTNTETEETETIQREYVEVTDEMEESVEKEILVLKLALASEEQPEFVEMMEEKRSYEVVSAYKEEGLTYVTLRFQVPDLYTIVKNMEIGEDWTEEQLDQAFTQAMTEAKLVELEGTLILYEEDGQTQVEVGEDFWDAYYGGIMRVRDEYYEELFGGTSDEE